MHPNKLLIATGQATGHDRREGRVSCDAFPDIFQRHFSATIFLSDIRFCVGMVLMVRPRLSVLATGSNR